MIVLIQTLLSKSFLLSTINPYIGLGHHNGLVLNATPILLAPCRRIRRLLPLSLGILDLYLALLISDLFLLLSLADLFAASLSILLLLYRGRLTSLLVTSPLVILLLSPDLTLRR